MAFVSVALSVAVLAAYIHERQDTHIATYVFPVDEYGRPGRIELAGRTYDPSRAELGYFIADWIRLVRSKSTDSIVLRYNWTKAYHFLTRTAAADLDLYARQIDPFSHVGQEAVSIDIASILPRSAQTYQVNWRETKFEQGEKPSASNWTGIFTITEKPPHDEEQLRNNPLGIFISSFQWSKEL
jgi:type IV secretion system protein VirB5